MLAARDFTLGEKPSTKWSLNTVHVLFWEANEARFVGQLSLHEGIDDGVLVLTGIGGAGAPGRGGPPVGR